MLSAASKTIYPFICTSLVWLRIQKVICLPTFSTVLYECEFGSSDVPWQVINGNRHIEEKYVRTNISTLVGSRNEQPLGREEGEHWPREKRNRNSNQCMYFSSFGVNRQMEIMYIRYTWLSPIPKKTIKLFFLCHCQLKKPDRTYTVYYLPVNHEDKNNRIFAYLRPCTRLSGSLINLGPCFRKN